MCVVPPIAAEVVTIVFSVVVPNIQPVFVQRSFVRSPAMPHNMFSLGCTMFRALHSTNVFVFVRLSYYVAFAVRNEGAEE